MPARLHLADDDSGRWIMHASPSKAELRALALAKRDALSDEQRAVAAEALARRGAPFEITQGMIISGYAPIRSELDPTPLMRKLVDKGARLALPCINARGQSLTFRSWLPQDRLMLGPLGIPEPSPAAAEVHPDVMLVPLAAFAQGQACDRGRDCLCCTGNQGHPGAVARRPARFCANGAQDVRFPE
jgi:5-formyltetrahydrofolate cyclo-ligase family